MTPNAHLSDLELAAFADGDMPAAEQDSVQAHLQRCTQCRIRLSADTGRPGGTRELSAAAEVPQIPEALRAALALRGSPDVRPDQLWRVDLPAAASMALVTAVTDDRAQVVPVTFDVEMADEYTLTVDATDSPLSLPLAVWTALRTVVPTSALATFLAQTDRLALADRAQQTYHAFLDDRPAAFEVGPQVIRPVDPRFAYREQLMETFGLLPTPHLDTGPHTVEEPDPKGRTSLTGHALSADSGGEPRVVEAVAHRIKNHPTIELLEDPWKWQVAPSIRPLVPVGLIKLLGMDVRVCAVPGVVSLDEFDRDELDQAIDVALLLRDCEQVAVVADNDDLDTVVVTAWDLHPAYITSGGRRANASWHPSSALPLDQALSRLVDEYLPDQPPTPVNMTSFTEPIAIGERAAAHARDGVESRRTSRATIPDKQAALLTLSADDANALAELVVAAHAGSDVRVEERLAELTEVVG